MKIVNVANGNKENGKWEMGNGKTIFFCFCVVEGQIAIFR